MERSTLEAKRDELQTAFDKQTQIKADAEAEQLRLQGEYRVINELLEKLDQPSEEPKKGKK